MSIVKHLIHSNCNANKSEGYSMLLHLQERSATDPSTLQALADSSPSLVSVIAVDISDDDEEIAALALKCLGFIIYHPALVAAISVDNANMLLEALANIVMATRMKSICNLGMWCISMQQFDESILAGHFDLVLLAVVHALDNPAGSLSTTFEAMQAVMKLASQLSEKMREYSHIWAPPIYRRLLSIDKKERDMSERCLLKIKSSVVPPSAALSKRVVEDLKMKLLAKMKDHLNQGMKVQMIQAWGWFICLLASYATKHRHLINEMLKIPEQTFSDRNPQVQIASQVAWEGLIDALIHPPLVTCETDGSIANGIVQHVQISAGNSGQAQSSGFLKSVKLIMTPLIGIMSSKCDASVHSSCLNTWCYLLHKLDISVNHPSLLELVLEPVLTTVFKAGPDCKTKWLWNLCVDTLDDFILAKCQQSGQVVRHMSTGKHMLGPSTFANFPWKHHPKWSPWAIDRLDFFIRMIDIIISHAHTINGSRGSSCEVASRIFRSVLKGVEMEFRSYSSDYSSIMLCLNTILKFIKKTCEGADSEGSYSKEFWCTSLQFLEAVVEELAPSILESPIYKVALDVRCIDNLLPSSDIVCAKVFGISSVASMDMVSPLGYIIVLYISVVIQSTSDVQRMELGLQGLHRFLRILLISFDPWVNLDIIVGLLYKYIEFRDLAIWKVVAISLKDCIEGRKDQAMVETELDNIDKSATCHLLSYPFFLCFVLQQSLAPDQVHSLADESNISAQRKLQFEHVIEVWESLFGALCVSNIKWSAKISFPEDLCATLNASIDTMVDSNTHINLCHKYLDLELLSLFGNTVASVLECILTFAASSDGNKTKHDDDREIFNHINNSLGFAARFLKFSLANAEGNQHSVFLLTSRVFSALAHVVSCLHMRETILSFLEILTCPLFQWLSQKELQDKSIINQLQHLWGEILNCLKRSKPPINFDSSFLKHQAPILEKSLDHLNSTISEVTIAFWNSTYGEQIKLDYPEILLDLLDKLYRNRRIKLCKRSMQKFVKFSIPEVTATHNWSSKRVALVDQSSNEDKLLLLLSSKRKRLELTEHQKEVRRAQQGRVMDCNGHGPGIRTYTNVDFSQGTKDSQEF